jgi:hypothetical protein
VPASARRTRCVAVRRLSLAATRETRAFALPNHVTGEVKCQRLGVPRVVDLVHSLFSTNRTIADPANVSARPIAGTDQRGHGNGQSSVIDSLLHARRQLALGTGGLGRHIAPNTPRLMVYRIVSARALEPAMNGRYGHHTLGWAPATLAVDAARPAFTAPVPLRGSEKGRSQVPLMRLAEALARFPAPRADTDLTHNPASSI